MDKDKDDPNALVPAPQQFGPTDPIHTHQYNFPHLRLGNASDSNKQRYLKIMLFFNKNPHIGHERFYAWWKTVHADLMVSAVDFGVHFLRYVQFRPEPKWDGVLSESMVALPYDACSELHVLDIDKWFEFTKTESFRNVLFVDSLNFVGGTIRFMAGYDHLIYGSGIRSSGGVDGIHWSDPRLHGKKVEG